MKRQTGTHDQAIRGWSADPPDSDGWRDGILMFCRKLSFTLSFILSLVPCLRITYSHTRPNDNDDDGRLRRRENGK